MEYTSNEYQLLIESISKHKDKKGFLIPILHDCLKIFGSVPFEIQKIISKEANVPISKINSIVTFYSVFNIEKSSTTAIEICTGSSCYVRGSYKLRDEFETRLGMEANNSNEKVSLSCVKCLGHCHKGPNIAVNDEILSDVKVEQVKEIIDNVEREKENE